MWQYPELSTYLTPKILTLDLEITLKYCDCLTWFWPLTFEYYRLTFCGGFAELCTHKINLQKIWKSRNVLRWIHTKNASIFFSSSLWVSTLKCYPKSNATPWVEKSSTSSAFHAPDTGFYLIGHLKTLCMSILSLNSGVESEWKHCSSPLSIKKC